MSALALHEFGLKLVLFVPLGFASTYHTPVLTWVLKRDIDLFSMLFGLIHDLVMVNEVWLSYVTQLQVSQKAARFTLD